MSWTQSTISTVDPWNCITFGKDTFVTVANITGNTATSRDGITWTQGTQMPWTMLWGNVWQDMTFNNDKFVTIGWAWNSAESLDGVNNWHGVNLPNQRYWNGVAYGQNTLVAVGTGFFSGPMNPYLNSIVALSNDPHDWSTSVMDVPAYWTDVAYGDRKFVAVSNGNSISSISTSQGRSWITSNNLPASQNWTAINYGNNKFVTVGNSNVAAYSTDGIHWTATTLPANQTWVDLAYGNNKWVAIGSNTSTAAVSNDAITWTSTTMPSSQHWTAITYGNGKFVAVACNTNVVATTV